MDEAGMANPAHEPFVVVSAVIVHADEQLRALEDALTNVVERHIPAESRDGFILHAAELFNGGGKVFRRDEWPLERRLAIADEIAGLIRKFQLPIAFGVCDRTGRKAVDDHVVAFILCMQDVEMFMRYRTDEVCLLIIEDNAESRKTLRLAQNLLRQRGFPMPPKFGAGPKTYGVPFERIREQPLFAPPESSSVLQLADFCAYVCKKWQMRDDRYNRFAVIGDQVIKVRAAGPASSSLEQSF